MEWTSRRCWIVISLVALGGIVFPAAGLAAGNGMRFVPNVVDQFNALTIHPDALGFGIGDSPNPSQCKHYQGVARVQASDGTPYLFVTKGGVSHYYCPGEDDEQGSLLVVRMGSRDKNGERLRSNRIARGTDVVHTPPDARDTTVKFFTFDGSGQFPSYKHPGGMQAVGNMLAITLEAPTDGEADHRVLFLDVSNPEEPRVTSSFVPEEDVESGVVGITPMPNGRYLMVLTGGDTVHVLWFYESFPTDGSTDGPTDLSSSNLSWRLADVWFPERHPDDGPYLEGPWPTDTAPQTLNFIREGDINGPLYLAGARGELNFGDDYVDLYRVDFIGDEIRLKQMSSRHFYSHANSDGSDDGDNNTASFAAASGYYVSPTGELIFYATEHDNDGPEVNGTATVKAGEWRHIDMVRPDSPTLLPSLQVPESYEIPEGAVGSLTAAAGPPMARPWIELFEDRNFTGRYVVIDFADYEKDDFDNFFHLDGAFVGFSDQASSWRYFAPRGTTIRANDAGIDDSGFPGEFTRTLAGTGWPEQDRNLADLRNDSGTGNIDDKLSSVQFLSDCAAYYAVTPNIMWDLDRNGTFETVGNSVTVDGADLDGPVDISIPVQAVHPMDGLTKSSAVSVHVTNVPPSINSFAFSESNGSPLGTTLAFVLQGSPVSFKATFTDPGRPDHQTATIDWGDGVVQENGVFGQWSDANGGVVGSAMHTHIYNQAGNFQTTLTVTDDDGGTVASVNGVFVATPLQALQSIVAQLDQAILNATGRQQKELMKAREELGGKTDGRGDGGAIGKLTRGETHPAADKVRHGIEHLRAAQRAGADVTEWISVLEQIASMLEPGGH